jgi:PAS domain S-box-containing protein
MINLLEVLHTVSNKLSDISEEKQIYQVMNDGIRQILPDSYFIITRLQPDDMNFRIIHSFGFAKYFAVIKTLMGKDPFQMDFPFSDLSEVNQKEFQTRKLHHAVDGIYEITYKRIGKTISKTIEKILGISEVYIISLCVGKNYFGGAVLFISKSHINSGVLSNDYTLTIENLVTQASFAINKLRDFENLKKKDDELAIAQSKFNQLVSQLNDIVWIANGDGTEINDFNNSFEKYFGYSSKEFVKNPNLWLEIVHEEDKDIARKSGDKLAADGNSECEYRIIKADGTILWIHERKTIVFDAKGNPLQMGGVATDITEKKLLEEEVSLKDYALENSNSAILFNNLQGIVTYVNTGCVKLFGYSDKEEMLGRYISEFASENDYKETVLDGLRKGEVFVEEIIPKRKDGSLFQSLVMASPIVQKEKILCIMATFVDITEFKELETSLMKSKSELLKLNDQKDKFFAIIAHDLKSPFNGLLGLLNLLHDDYSDYTDQQRMRMIHASLAAAKKEYALLLDLLEWASLENNQVKIGKETVAIDDVVAENINFYLTDAKQKGILIKNNINLRTQVDIDLNSMNTVIRNILTNAIKFTQSGGSITFSTKRTNHCLELAIKDTGVGMDQATLDKLFKLDKKVSMPGTNNEKGTGLGLAICKEILKKNHWKIEVESQLEKGSVFRLFIPINEIK